MLKFLVTGAAGQLGKDVVRELENRGYEVTGSGSKKRKTTGRYVKMDITDRNEVEAVMKKLRPDIVIHRVTGDGPKDLLIAPLWASRKREVLNLLHHRMKERASFQGKALEALSRSQ